MNKKLTILIYFAVMISACSEINKKEIQGNWLAIPDGINEPPYYEININNKSIDLFDEYGFLEKGSYSIKNDLLKIELERDYFDLETTVKQINRDSIILFENTIFRRNKSGFKTNIEFYELIGVPTEDYLEPSKSINSIIHLYIGKDNELKLRLGDKISDFNKLPMFVSGISNSTVIIFVGKGIELKDLNELYFHLYALGKGKVWLGVKREDLNKTHILNDRVEYWWDDYKLKCEERKKPSLPPPPTEITSLSKFINNGGKEIKFLSRKDFVEINNLTKEENYTITIDVNLPIEDYFEIKKSILKKKDMGFNIFTTID